MSADKGKTYLKNPDRYIFTEQAKKINWELRHNKPITGTVDSIRKDSEFGESLAVCRNERGQRLLAREEVEHGEAEEFRLSS